MPDHLAHLTGTSLPKEIKATSMIGQSRSTPSLGHSFALRKYNTDRKRNPGHQPDSMPCLPVLYDEYDLMGGNGRWRQRLAEEDFEQKKIEAEERQRQEKLKEEERIRRRKLQEERRRKQLEDERKELMAFREAQRRQAEEKERKRAAEEEEARQRREQEERDFLAKQPKACEVCSGSGRCASCEGTGVVFGMFLVPSVSKDLENLGVGGSVDFGRLQQGCTDCLGGAQNLMGKLRGGTGYCAHCMGRGKIWPKGAKAGRRLQSQMTMGFGAFDSSPKSPSGGGGLP